MFFVFIFRVKIKRLGKLRVNLHSLLMIFVSSSSAYVMGKRKKKKEQWIRILLNA